MLVLVLLGRTDAYMCTYMLGIYVDAPRRSKSIYGLRSRERRRRCCLMSDVCGFVAEPHERDRFVAERDLMINLFPKQIDERPTNCSFSLSLSGPCFGVLSENGEIF